MKSRRILIAQEEAQAPHLGNLWRKYITIANAAKEKNAWDCGQGNRIWMYVAC
jgi:hypothetical protein